MITVYVSIGNSDDKLTQQRWSRFHVLVADALRREAVRMHGEWLSSTAAAWQNACWCAEFEDSDRTARLKDELRRLAAEFGQDSIAWAEAPKTEFLSC